MRVGIEALAFRLYKDMPLDDETLGQAAERYGESVERIMDALDVIKIVLGEPTQYPAIVWLDDPR